MKKFFVVLAMLATTLAASAQFEKGKTYVAADFTGLTLDYTTGSEFSFGIYAKGGAFVTDNWSAYGLLAYQHLGGLDANVFKVGGGGRYYILQNGLFLGASAAFAYDKVKSSNAIYDLKPAIEVGYAFFVSGEVTIEPSIYYEQSCFHHGDRSTVGLKIGVGLYHKKNKIKNSVVEAFEKENKVVETSEKEDKFVE